MKRLNASGSIALCIGTLLSLVTPFSNNFRMHVAVQRLSNCVVVCLYLTI